MPTTAELHVHLRWFVRADLPAVLAIERASFAAAWGEDDFVEVLNRRSAIGMVAEAPPIPAPGSLGGAGGLVYPRIGYMLYELAGGRLEVLNFAVHPDYRRRGVGKAMAEKLLGKLSHHHRRVAGLVVRDGNLPAQLFWRACGFRAVEVWRGYYEEQGEDGYRMEYRRPSTRPDPARPPAGGSS